jgi:exodeoxyribonuclease V alpha subunit
MIEKAWATQKAIKEVMIFLRGHGVSTTYAVKIYKQYGDQAIEVVSHNRCYEIELSYHAKGHDRILQSPEVSPEAYCRQP